MLLLPVDHFVITLLLDVISGFGSGTLLFAIVEAPHRASWIRQSALGVRATLWATWRQHWAC
jgi:hypothetical protein